ncbi:uncharacterized protein IL334_003903 [Kwoniella shivajii]|uniref:F-box domain-containing protein n=1 Tax=Kwoniella shivajii TaxID=564305 RepID=A0ABZ1CYV6_9TREE|nr:hypothetical protein IL334_003903 [Kwoniella shivajii]
MSCLPRRPVVRGSGGARLPDDVLIQIFKLLQQSKSTIIIRGQTRYYNLIVPLIYTKRMTITQPAKFFYGIDHIPTNGRQPKYLHLSGIRNLIFDFPNEYRTLLEIQTSIRSLGSLDWSQAVLGFENRNLFHITEYITILVQLDFLNDLFISPELRDIDLFPHLQTLSFARWKKWIYKKSGKMLDPKESLAGICRCDSPRIKQLLNERLLIQDEFAKNMRRITNVRNDICDHSHGPYSIDIDVNPQLVTNTSINQKKGQKPISPITYTKVIGCEHDRYKIPLPILCGSTTRYLIDEECFTRFMPDRWSNIPHEQTRISSSIKFLSLFRNLLTESFRKLYVPSSDKIPLGQTRIIIYIPVDPACLVEVMKTLRPSKVNIGGTTSTVTFKGNILVELAKWLEGKKGSCTRSKGVKLEVKWRKDAGPCPACGLVENR